MPKQCYAHFLVNFFFLILKSHIKLSMGSSATFYQHQLFVIVSAGQSEQLLSSIPPIWLIPKSYIQHVQYSIYTQFIQYIYQCIYIYIFIYLCIVSISMSSDHRNGSTIRFFFHLNNQTSLVLMKHEVLTFTSLATDIHT